MTRSIPSLIKQRRSQMLIHSYLYYVLDNPIISDDKWQEWADELEKVQAEYPEHKKINWYDKTFSDWTAATGCHLPRDDPWVIRKANQLLKDDARINPAESLIE